MPGVGPGSAGMDLAAMAREAALSSRGTPAGAGPSKAPTADSVAALLRDLTPSDLTRILAVIEPAPVAGMEARAADLLQAAVTAAAQQEPGRSLPELKQLVTLDPSSAGRLAFELGLESIRPDVERLMLQLSGSARLHAEGRLAEATHRWESQPFKADVRDFHPETWLLVANRLIEAGGLSNYIRSAAVSGYLIDPARWAPAFEPGQQPVVPSLGKQEWSIARLVPLWFALGFGAGCLSWWLQYDRVQTIFEIWAGGLLVLVCSILWQRSRRFRGLDG